MGRSSTTALLLTAAVALPALAREGRRFAPSTPSTQARELLARLQENVENLVFGKENVELARKLVAADADWAMGVYYLSAVTAAPESQELLARAAELAKQASDGERRFVEAMVVARSSRPEPAISALQGLAADYPGERVVLSLLGQLLAGQGRASEARAAFENAIALDPTTPRAHSFVGNLALLQGRYDEARRSYQEALRRMPAGAAPGPLRHNLAFTWLYEGKPDRAIASLEAFLVEYRKTAQPLGLAEVFIWNSIARIQLESGRPEEALKAYERAYAGASRSGLGEDERQLWLGRLHHGKGRCLARMGRFDAAWREAETVQKMIAASGARGKPHEPAWHYLAGYIALEQGDAAAAITHLEQSQPSQDPFRGLLLGRAYEKAGDRARARRAYEAVLAFDANTIERALAYPEARKRLAGLPPRG